MTGKNVGAGVSAPQDTVGLTGLVPFEVVRMEPVTLRPAPGTVRLSVTLPAGRVLQAGKAICYRIHGFEAGVQVDRGGQIVALRDAQFPVEVAYGPREFPEPPPRGQMVLDVAFWHTDGHLAVGQDVQWRIPIVWDGRGGNTLDLRFELPAR